MRASLILCDWAEVVAGKLYMQGGGWIATPAHKPMSQFAVASLVETPYDETNEIHDCRITLLTEDGVPYPLDQPMALSFGFKAGRPPGLKPGMSQIVPHAAKIYGIPFAPGVYAVELAIDGEIVATASFQAVT